LQGFVEPSFQNISGRQFRKVLGDSDAASLEL